MQRSKQQALMFLLGATLVGGALGFSADRILSHDKVVASFGPRSKFYDELGLTAQQRDKLDSLAFEQECVVRSLLAPQDSALKSIRARFQAQRDSVFTKEQLAELKTRRADMDRRREAERAKEPKRTCSGN
jgi:Spy/CpxP family protein refolding chaperone